MQIQIKNARISFPALFAPNAYGDGDAKYECTFIIEPGSANDLAIRDAIKQAAADKWGAKAPKILEVLTKGENNHYVYKTSDRLTKDGEVYDGFEGKFWLKAKNASRPKVVDRDRSELSQSDGKPYSGCYVNAIIDVFTYDNTNARGIGASLGAVQFVRDGEAFGKSAPVSADAFEDLGVGEDDLALA